MKFGPMPLDDARGGIMAHSQRVGDTMIRKGARLDEAAIGALRAAGRTDVICAMLEPGDVPEDIAADRLATPLVSPLIARSRAATGRVNLLAEDGSYSVVFGVVCLLGVLAGLVLQVRAYLALGTLFLTLDIIANLVHAGLRDHRVGFVLLSVSGLGILGIMIGITLRRDWAWGIARRFRSRLSAWD